MKRKDPCDNCKYHDDGLCLRPTKNCVKEMRNEKIHETINSILMVISLIVSIAVLLIIRFS